MALPAATQFSLRADGDNTNGGGFVLGSSGTNWSLQAAPQYSVTDGVSNGTTTITSATANFGTDVVGNIMNFGGAWFQIVSRTSALAVVVDRTVSAATNQTIKIGGAFLTQAQVNSIAVANCTVVVKTGTYAVTAAISISLDSSAAPGNPYTWTGYGTTPGDGGTAPTWTTSTNSIDLVACNQAKNVAFQNIAFSSTAGTPGNGFHSGVSGSGDTVGLQVLNCTLSGFLVGIEGNFNVNWAFTGLNCIGTRVTACTSHGIRNGATTYCLACQLDNNGGDNFNTNTDRDTGAAVGGLVFENTIFYKAGASGFNMAYSNSGGITMQAVVFKNCNFSTNTTAGFILSSNATNPLPQFTNCIFDANGTYGVDCASGTVVVQALLFSNAFFNNGTAATRNTNAGTNTITLTGSPYVAVGTNFALNSTAGAGAACKGAGYPASIPGAFSGAAPDVGAFQSPAGGSTVVVVPSVTQIRYIQQ